MENIIHQIVVNTAQTFLDYVEANGIISLDRMAEDFKAVSDGMALQVLEAFVSEADKAICDAKAERKSDGIAIHERGVPRTLLTALGDFTYSRAYFDTPGGRAYILDNLLGVHPYERIDAGISAKLVNTAATHSYGRSASIVAGDQVSRQSAWNKAMNTGEVAYVPERADYVPEALHIFADEDHVPLQDGTNAIVALVTVCAGKRHVCKGRNELVEPFHVQGYGMDKDTLWGYVYALCEEKFDMGRIGKVFIYGDGASWIKGGLNVFPDAVPVIDTFHYKKRMRSLFSGQAGSQFSLKAYGAVNRGDKATFMETARAMMDEALRGMPDAVARDKKAAAILGNINYIIQNWSAIQGTKLPGVIGSCTEAMISHVLSERLSRGPMGWSRKGLSKMAMLRVFVVNGGKVQPADTLSWKHSDKRNRVAKQMGKYDSIVKLQQDEIFKDVKNWRWFERDSWISGKTTGTKVALDALGKLRNVS